jgi:hypothetical protein
MNKLYVEGLIDSEFMIDKEAIQKMIAGTGSMMSLNYVEYVRQMAAFQEKNPDGELVYIDPPVGANGESGYLAQDLVSLAWIVPKTSEDKVMECVDFLDKCNASEAVVNALALGFEGEDYVSNGDVLEKTDHQAEVAYKGYYSRVICDNRFDDGINMLEGFSVNMPFLESHKNTNDILTAPMDVPASGGSIPEIQQAICDDVMVMIVQGYTDEAFAAMQSRFDSLGGNQVLSEYQEWYDNRG